MEKNKVCKIIMYIGISLMLLSIVSAYNLSKDFEVDYSKTLRFDWVEDKYYFNFNLENVSSNYSKFHCISYVADNKTKKNIIQTNPTYKKESGGINIFNRDYDNRTYFPADNKIGKAYFTKENLVIDGREYVFGIECANPDGRYVTEKIAKVKYSSVTAPQTRIVWANQNTTGIFLVVFFSVIVLLLLGLVIGYVKKRW